MRAGHERRPTLLLSMSAPGEKNALMYSRIDCFGLFYSSCVLFVFVFFCVCVLFGRPSNRREAVPVSLARVSVAFRAQRRADAPLSQTHRRQAVPVQSVRALLRPLRSPGAAHETAPAQRFQMNGLPCSAPRTLDCHRSLSVFFFVASEPRATARNSRANTNFQCSKRFLHNAVKGKRGQLSI